MEDRGGIRRDRTRPARGFRTGSLLFAALLLCASAAACEAGTEDPPAFTPIAADAEGIVAIPVEGITEKARFFDYDADGTVVQLVALRDGSGAVHVAFNTCQSCTPSPKAYYTQSGDLLRCENCGFTFRAEEVGITRGGCSPWPVDGAVIGGDAITMPEWVLQRMQPLFMTWGGPTGRKE